MPLAYHRDAIFLFPLFLDLEIGNGRKVNKNPLPIKSRPRLLIALAGGAQIMVLLLPTLRTPVLYQRQSLYVIASLDESHL